MLLSFDLGNPRAQHCREQQNSDQSPGSTHPIKRSSKSRANSPKDCALEHVPKKLLDFFDQDMLHSLILSESLSIK
ncbi:MAG: hypothetical protein ACREDH_13260 [Methylocella sp.]